MHLYSISGLTLKIQKQDVPGRKESVVMLGLTLRLRGPNRGRLYSCTQLGLLATSGTRFIAPA
jgi:hypothetical protein